LFRILVNLNFGQTIGYGDFNFYNIFFFHKPNIVNLLPHIKKKIPLPEDSFVFLFLLTS